MKNNNSKENHMENRKKWMEEKKEKIMNMFSDIQLIMDENEDDPAKEEILLHELGKEYNISYTKIMSIYNKYFFNSKDEKFKDITDLPNKPISFVIEEFIPCNSVILLFGNSGIGKSTLTYSWAYHVATGKDWNGRQVKQGKVLIIQLEENEQTTNDRWSHVKDDTPKNTVFTKQSYSGTLPFHLKKSIKEYNPSLIIVDSFSVVNSLNGTNENDALCNRILNNLKEIADKNNVSIIVCHHENKRGGYRGSTAIRAAVSEMIRFYKPTGYEKNKRVLEVDKTRQGKNYQYVLEGDENNYLNWTIVGESNENKANPEKDNSLSKIQNYLNEIRPEKVTNKTIADETGLKLDTVKKALDRYFKDCSKYPDIKIEREKIDRGYVYSSGVTMRTVELVEDINDDVEKISFSLPPQRDNVADEEKCLMQKMMDYCLQSYQEEDDSKCWEVFVSLKNKWTQEVSARGYNSTNLWKVTKNRLENAHGKVSDRLYRLSLENQSKTKTA